MKTRVFYDNLGRVLNAVTQPEGMPFSDDLPHVLISTPLRGKLRDYYVQAGEVVRKPEQPTPQHEWSYSQKAWVLAEAAAKKRAQNDLRYLRTELLAESDWTQVPDAPVDAEAWRVYRQQLRDLPEQYPDILSIDEVVWPNPPS